MITLCLGFVLWLLEAKGTGLSTMVVLSIFMDFALLFMSMLTFLECAGRRKKK